MARIPQGTVRTRTLATGRTAYYARFRAPDMPGGPSKLQEVPLGKSPAVNDDIARRSLSHIMADVQRGRWTKADHREARAKAAVQGQDPLMEAAITDWVAAKQKKWAPATASDYMWQVRDLLLPYWGKHPVSEVTIGEIRAWVRWLEGETLLDARGRVKRRGFKTKKGDTLAPSTINAALNRLAAVLQFAVESEHCSLQVSPFQQAKFRLDDPPSDDIEHDYLGVDELLDLLQAARTLEAHRHPSFANLGRPALLATLFMGGLRVTEVCSLHWQDIDLQAGKVKIKTGKTRNSVRTVNIVPGLRVELEAWREVTAHAKPTDWVFPTKTGNKRDKDNVRNRILHPTLRAANATREAANEKLDDRDQLPPIELRGTHTGRRTYATHMLSIGERPGYVQDQLGHASVELTMGLYRQAADARSEIDERLYKLYRLPKKAVKTEPDE